MTRNDESNAAETAMQMIYDNGMDGLAGAIRLLLNEAMEDRTLARSGRGHLQAATYGRTDERRGHANGFKPKTVATRLGPVRFEIPQVRGEEVEFYPSALAIDEHARTAQQGDPPPNPRSNFVPEQRIAAPPWLRPC